MDNRVSNTEVIEVIYDNTEKIRRRRALKRKILNDWELYLLLLPPLIYFIIWSYVPMYGVLMAFKDFRISLGIWGSEWVGLLHFQRFFNSIHFERLMVNTVGISVYSLLAGFPLPIIFALMLNELKNKFFKKTVQTIAYAPFFISVVVMVGMITMFFSPLGGGIVNQIIVALGREPVPFLTDPRYFWHLFVWTGVWQGTGWGTVIYLAALAGVDTEQLEAATIDGASKLQRIWYITFPCILPTAIILLILSAGGIMNVSFERIFLMQNTLNMSRSDVIATHVYRVGLLDMRYDFAAAVGLFNSVINLFMLVLVNWIARRVSDTSLL